ncbi:hypothetical protein QFC21_005903 [Naganishia friedmannii]|uniref:Uncharacterized protein n=1 Tax=Naganishia friedmannii TaxID=89922 RepID=A0ACC2V6L0_9TREE|nr:hypothetical protein QFC21_005903 [Naganishia friedmannii]
MKQYLTSIASTDHQHWLAQYVQPDISIFSQVEARATEIDSDWRNEVVQFAEEDVQEIVEEQEGDTAMEE